MKKTNAMRILDGLKISYETLSYDDDGEHELSRGAAAGTAAKLGISPAAFYSYIYGLRAPSLTTLLMIANVTNVDLNYLIGEKSDIKPERISMEGMNKKIALHLCRNCQHKNSDACVACNVKKVFKKGGI